MWLCFGQQEQGREVHLFLGARDRLGLSQVQHGEEQNQIFGERYREQYARGLLIID